MITHPGKSRPPPIERIIRPLQVFARHQLAGAIILLASTAAAVIWANSPWEASYRHLLETEITIGMGHFVFSKHLLHWINDGLMAVFFFVVGLEIKREILAGELSSIRKAALPVAGALGGMAVPAAIYFALNAGGPGERGWGIPMATDIAFALGVLALLGKRVPIGLKVFLTALAIVDDIGAILVIAVFYTDHIVFGGLLIAALAFTASIAANVSGVRNPLAYFILGAIVWLAFLQSGVHATLAAVLMAFTIPARTRIDGVAFKKRIGDLLGALDTRGLPRGKKLLDVEQQKVLHGMEDALEQSMPPLQRLEHVLTPFVTFIVLPFFALANAGVSLGADFTHAFRNPVALGIIAGLVLGKQIGITGFSYLAVKAGIADLPSSTGWKGLHAVSILGGIGFTMSLFIAGLAFPDPALMDVSRVGILSASLVSGIIGLGLMFLWSRWERRRR